MANIWNLFFRLNLKFAPSSHVSDLLSSRAARAEILEIHRMKIMFLHRSLRKSSEIHSLLVLRLSLTIRVYLHSLLPLLPFKLLSLLTCRCTKYFALHLQDVCHCPPGCSQARYRAVTVTSAVNTSSMKVLLQKCKTFAVTGT